MEGCVGGSHEQRDEGGLRKEIQEVVYGVMWSHVMSVPKDKWLFPAVCVGGERCAAVCGRLT